MTPRDPHLSNSWLLRFARAIFSDDTMTRVVLPTLADLEHEVQEAGDDVSARKRAKLRGYLAFCKLVALSPFAFADWPGRRQFGQSMVHVGAIVILLAVILGAQSDWMMRFVAALFTRFYSRLLSIADLGPYVWLLTPIAVGVLLLMSRRSPMREAPSAVILISAATVAAAATYGSIGFVAGFDAVGRSGSAGFGVVIPAVNALAIPTLLALGVGTITALLVAFSQWRGRHTLAGVATETGESSGLAALLTVVSLGVGLAAANQWLLMNEELLEAALSLALPARNPHGGVRAALGRAEIAVPLIMLGFLVATTILAAALAAWRGSHIRRPNRIMQWATRVALVAVIVGSIWHANIISRQWTEFQNAITEMRRAS